MKPYADIISFPRLARPFLKFQTLLTWLCSSASGQTATAKVVPSKPADSLRSSRSFYSPDY